MKYNRFNSDNFWNYVEKTDSCWFFTWKKDESSRARSYRFMGRKIRPIHIAWYLCKGHFSDGELRRQCSNVFCINPDHYVEYHQEDIKSRFMLKVKLSPSGCWEWTAYKNPGGYGMFKVRRTEVEIASRFSYKLFIGEIPDGLDVLHTCDNRGCVNPDHFFLGKDIDNCMDKEIKNRGSHKLNPDLVKKIREESKVVKSKSELARKYNLSKQCIYKLLNRQSWRWINEN